MAKYKVIVVGILKANGQTAYSGDILDEAELIDADQSVKGGYVELVAEDAPKDASVKEDAKSEDAANDAAKETGNDLIDKAKKG